jgi:nucleoside-diphosphate-sugar epimerase
MVSAIAAGRYLGVGTGTARRSMVRLADVAEVFPKIAVVGGVFHLTDGFHPSFAELESAIAAALDRRPPLRLPTPLARAAAVAGDVLELLVRRRMPFNHRTLVKMTSTLTFSDEKARRLLGWQPTRVLDFVRELLESA